jgi:hypothetical protein
VPSPPSYHRPPSPTCQGSAAVPRRGPRKKHQPRRRSTSARLSIEHCEERGKPLEGPPPTTQVASSHHGLETSKPCNHRAFQGCAGLQLDFPARRDPANSCGLGAVRRVGRGWLGRLTRSRRRIYHQRAGRVPRHRSVALFVTAPSNRERVASWLRQPHRSTARG